MTANMLYACLQTAMTQDVVDQLQRISAQQVSPGMWVSTCSYPQLYPCPVPEHASQAACHS
jgi:hypothetical protein